MSNNVGGFSDVVPASSQQEDIDESRMQNGSSKDQELDSKVETDESPQQVLSGWSDAFTKTTGSGEGPSMPRVPSEIATQIYQEAPPETRKAMRSAGPWLRSAVNPGVRTITLKGPTGTNQGSSISQAFSVFRGAKDLTLKDDPNGDQFTNDHAKELASFGTLQSLTLDKTTGLTGAALTGLPKNLQSLKMMGTDEVTDEHLKSLPQNLKTFVSLHTGITDAGMTNLPKGLETLGLTGGYANAGLKDLPPNLKRFFVGSQEVNDAGIKSLPKTLNQLDIVSSNVTGSAIKDIPESVHTLGLPFSYRNMNDGLKDISKNVHTLTVAHDVDDAAITSLPKTVRNVHLMGDVSSERLQQLQNARTGTKITAETRASYLDKIRLTFRRDGWVGGEPETPSSHKG